MNERDKQEVVELLRHIADEVDAGKWHVSSIDDQHKLENFGKREQKRSIHIFLRESKA